MLHSTSQFPCLSRLHEKRMRIQSALAYDFRLGIQKWFENRQQICKNHEHRNTSAKNNKADQKLELWGVHRITPSPWSLQTNGCANERHAKRHAKRHANRWLPTTTHSSPFQRRIELRLVKHSRQDQGPKNTRRATDPSTSGKGIKSLAN